MAGQYLLGDLKKEGIDHRYVKVIPSGRSSFSFVVSNRYNASRTLFSYHDRLPPVDFSTPGIREYIAGARCVHLDGTMYENAIGAAQTARELGVMVSLDGCSMQKDNEKNWVLVRLADVLIMNETYPTRLTGIEDRKLALLEIARAGPRIVMSTSGDRGCMAFNGDTVDCFPAFSIKPVDTTGAGDAFHGGFLYGMLAGMPLVETFRLVSAVGALNCLTMGGRKGLPDMKMVQAFLNENSWP